jgi:hypothetical protein
MTMMTTLDQCANDYVNSRYVVLDIEPTQSLLNVLNLS